MILDTRKVLLLETVWLLKILGREIQSHLNHKIVESPKSFRTGYYEMNLWHRNRKSTNLTIAFNHSHGRTTKFINWTPVANTQNFNIMNIDNQKPTEKTCNFCENWNLNHMKTWLNMIRERNKKLCYLLKYTDSNGWQSTILWRCQQSSIELWFQLVNNHFYRCFQ